MVDAGRHDESHERILRDVLTGDRTREDDAVQLLLARCDECADALDELDELGSALDEDAQAEREALGPAAGEPAPAPPARRRAPWLRPVAVFVPLAAAVLALFLLRGRDVAPDDGGGGGIDPGVGLPLGESIRVLGPRGEVDAWGEFRWEADLPSGGWYTLSIWADRREPGKKPVIEEDLEDTTWRPTAEQLERMPDRIEWRVRVRGTSLDSDDAEAWLPGS